MQPCVDLRIGAVGRQEPDPDNLAVLGGAQESRRAVLIQPLIAPAEGGKPSLSAGANARWIVAHSFWMAGSAAMRAMTIQTPLPARANSSSAVVTRRFQFRLSSGGATEVTSSTNRLGRAMLLRTDCVAILHTLYHTPELSAARAVLP
jgi:hypothetical protein